MDTEGEGVLSISDFRELGYEYLKYLGENYIRCQECGVLTKGNKNGTKKFCAECAKYIPMETRIICCIDCGESFTVSAKNHKTVRCAACQKEYRKQYDRERKKNSAQQMKDEQENDMPNHQ